LAISAKAKKMKSEGLDVVSLSAGEPDMPTPENICRAAKKAIDENFTRYTPVAGIPELKKAISEKLSRDNNLQYSPDEIIVSNGGKQAIANIIMALCNKDDQVIIPAPYWVSYPEMARLAEAVPVTIAAGIENDFKVTAA